MEMIDMPTADAERNLMADGLLTVQEALEFTWSGRTDLYARINRG